MSTSELLQNCIQQRSCVSLAELAPLALLDRTDTKFVLHQEQLHEVLAEELPGYHVLAVEGLRFNRYSTTYFDTPDRAMYYDHHNGKRSRFKLRCRTYLDSGSVFIEAKMKTNKQRTVKFRLPVAQQPARLDQLDGGWLPSSFPYRLETLQATVWNQFTRVTLASFTHSERVTLDMDIVFGDGAHGVSYAGLCIVELKQPKFSLVRSPLALQLHRRHLRPQAISKYCIAAGHFYAGCRTNRFKPLLLQLAHSFPLRGACECIA